MKRRFTLLALIAPAVFLLDQWTKSLVIHFIPEGNGFPVTPFFDLVHTRNPGAAFGSFATLPDGARLPFFFVTSAIAVVAVLWYFIRLNDPRKTPYVSLALILGGAFGNILDRIRYREVIDFLSVHWHHQWVNLRGLRFKLEWPAFNIADSAITVGIFLFLIVMMKKPESS